MNTDLIVDVAVTIHAPRAKVWHALTDPEEIKKYLFGTETKTDWKEGSPITFSGEWEGKSYVDKGTVLKVEKEKMLKYTYWSSFSGAEDKPENYANVTYSLDEVNDSTVFHVLQDNVTSTEARDHSEQNWMMIMNMLKDLLEK
jgi:uncharacterized protein YndB with AHSA1/START domain